MSKINVSGDNMKFMKMKVLTSLGILELGDFKGDGPCFLKGLGLEKGTSSSESKCSMVSVFSVLIQTNFETNDLSPVGFTAGK